jgi:hypothetical protein
MAVPDPAAFERLGVFYLGAGYDLARGARTDDLVLYDSKDLTTHALCVGMTGSGKTGLCVGLIEEAILDGVPAILIDPKGDLANLMLAFPTLEAAEFEPWVHPDDAERKGVSVGDFARDQAGRWKDGLASWGQDGARVAKLRDAAEFTIFTPGGDAGRKLSVLSSFDAPPEAVRADAELFRQLAATTVSSLLGLLEIDADPVQSREHILLTTLLLEAWKSGRACDVPSLITQVQAPPMAKVGVLDIETFFPAKERFGLVMKLNNLLASPSFAAWTEGEPLDAGALLRTADGRPRVSILSIAHLSDAERMFFVSLLLNQVVGWMRRQSGTSSLRALLYMDEIAGYFPPVANPPSKPPLLTLLKQARAFGLGVALTTQNPADLDYKGLGNIGTWFIGRLQTERDKARILEGLKTANQQASAARDDAELDRMLSSLGNRVFLMNNVHEDGPVLFTTRWTLSYLRGPVDREGIRRLMAGRTEASAGAGGGLRAAAPGEAEPGERRPRPALAPGVVQYFLPARAVAPAGASLAYEPRVAGVVQVLYADAKRGVNSTEEITVLCPFGAGAAVVDWAGAAACATTAADLAGEPAGDADYDEPPAAAGVAKNYAAWGRELVNWVVANRALELRRSPSTGLVSEPGEAEREFRARAAQAGRESRDAAVEKVRAQFAKRMESLDGKLRTARDRVAREKAQSQSQMWQTAMSVGTSVLGALMGRKKFSAANISRAGTAMRGAGRSYKEQQDVGIAEESVEALEQQRAALEQEAQSALAGTQASMDPATESLETILLRPAKARVTVRSIGLAWCPAWRDALGNSTPAWE